MPDTFSLFFVRHGQTDYNAQKIIQGQCDRAGLPGIEDMGLNETGRLQAWTLAERLMREGVTFDLVLSSDLRRALETGEIIGAALGVDIAPCPGLREMFFGQTWEGCPVQVFKDTHFTPPLRFLDPTTDTYLEAADGETVRAWHKSTDPRYENVAHPGGESKREVAARARAALAAFAQENPTIRRVLIPTHNGLLRFLMPELGAVDHVELIETAYNPQTQSLTLVGRTKA